MSIVQMDKKEEKDGQQITKHITDGQHGINLSRLKKRSVEVSNFSPSPEGPKVSRQSVREHVGGHPT